MADTTNTPKPAATAAPVSTEAKEAPKKQVSTTLDAAQYKAFQDVRFSQRHETSGDLVKAALVEYLAKHSE